DGRVALHVQELRSAQMSVPKRNAGREAVRSYLHLDLGLIYTPVRDAQNTLDLRERASHVDGPEPPHSECDTRVVAIQVDVVTMTGRAQHVSHAALPPTFWACRAYAKRTAYRRRPPACSTP